MGKDLNVAEELLKHYRAISVRIFNQNKKLTLINNRKNNAIEGQFMKAQQLKDMPGTPQGSYKGQKLLMIDDEEYEELCHEESFIKDELETLLTIKECINESLNSLQPVEKSILIYFYIEGMSMVEITDRVHYKERNCKYIKKQALDYLNLSLEPFRKEALKICTIFALSKEKHVV